MTPAPGVHRRADAARRVVVCACAAVVALFVVVIVVRSTAHAELEWEEGGMAEHVERLLAGKPLYVAPSLDFVPFVYPPLYYEVAALLTRVTGDALLGCRAVSVAATLGTLGLLFDWGRRETGDPLAGLVAAALYASTYAASGGWTELARVDAFFVALVLAAAYCARVYRSIPGAMGSGALFALAFFAKQPAVGIAIFVALALAVQDARRALAFAAVSFGGMALGTLALDRVTSGRFSYYVIELPSHHGVVVGAWLGFWASDLPRPVGFALVAGIAASVRRFRSGGQDAVLALFAAGCVAASWASRLHFGGYLNDLMPALMAVSLAGGVACVELTRGRGWVAPALILVQMALALTIRPWRSFASPSAMAADEARTVGELRALPGDVWITSRPRLARLAGKRPYAHEMALFDVLRGDPEQVTSGVGAETRHAIQAGHFAAIVDDATPKVEAIPRGFDADIRAAYPRIVPTFEPPRWPTSGSVRRVAVVRVPEKGGDGSQ